MNMVTKVATKPDTQAMIKALRAAGLTVTKTGTDYKCFADRDETVLLFKAMAGQTGYLIRMADNLFTAETQAS